MENIYIKMVIFIPENIKMDYLMAKENMNMQMEIHMKEIIKKI